MPQDQDHVHPHTHATSRLEVFTGAMPNFLLAIEFKMAPVEKKRWARANDR
jgi:hypothetical protein